MSRLGIGGHQKGGCGLSDDWLTPPEILKALGEFDLDPCASENQPWSTARCALTIKEDGLASKWAGRVWLNPPYGRETWKWLARLAEHGNGIALTFARTETEMFHRLAWEMANAMLFLEGRIRFLRPGGVRTAYTSGAPSVLIAYGNANVESLERCGIKGFLVKLR